MTRPRAIGSKDPCPHCGKPAERKASSDGSVELWHRPVGCCDAAKAQRPAGAPRFMPRRDFRGRTPSPDELEARKEAADG